MEIERALQQLELAAKESCTLTTVRTAPFTLDAVDHRAHAIPPRARGVAMSILAGESQKLMTSPRRRKRCWMS